MASQRTGFKVKYSRSELAVATEVSEQAIVDLLGDQAIYGGDDHNKVMKVKTFARKQKVSFVKAIQMSKQAEAEEAHIPSANESVDSDQETEPPSTDGAIAVLEATIAPQVARAGELVAAHNQYMTQLEDRTIGALAQRTDDFFGNVVRGTFLAGEQRAAGIEGELNQLVGKAGDAFARFQPAPKPRFTQVTEAQNPQLDGGTGTSGYLTGS